MITIKATYGVLKISEPHEPVSGDYYRENDPKWIAFRKKYRLKQGTDPIYKWYMLCVLSKSQNLTKLDFKLASIIPL